MTHQSITTKTNDGHHLNPDSTESLALQRMLRNRLRNRQGCQKAPRASLGKAKWSPEVIKETRFSAILYR